MAESGLCLSGINRVAVGEDRCSMAPKVGSEL